jgi:uncharacterized protein
MIAEEDIEFDVSGGPVLEARLGVPPNARGGLVVCHPHPLYGGDMDNPVVVRTVEVARESGLSTLRFNFRGAGRSSGTHAQGIGEVADVLAALATLRSRVPAGRPLGLAGYSFGAAVASRTADPNGPLAALGLIAPPLAMFDWSALDAGDRDLLLVSGTRDPYCPQPELAALAERLRGAELVTIDGADHFFFGKLFPLGEAVRRWVSRWAA